MSRSASHPNKSGNQAWGMGTEQKTQAEKGRSKGQTEAEGSEREAQRVTAERAKPESDGGEKTAIRKGEGTMG